jgi:hypothetical protein
MEILPNKIRDMLSIMVAVNQLNIEEKDRRATT